MQTEAKKNTLSGLKNCHKIIYRKRFLNDNRNIVLTRNITKGRFWNMSENNNYKNIFLCLLLLPNSSERRSRFQTMLHFCQNQVHDMSPVLLLALSQKSHGGVVELMKKQKTQLGISSGFRSVRVLLILHLLQYTIPCISGFLSVWSCKD